MSRSYTPGLKILTRTKISKKRQLPMKGVVHLKIGDIVKPDKVVASTEIPGNVQMVNVASKLNVEPENVPECMLVELDENISKNQIIAESKGILGMFKNQLKSPIDGTLSNVSEITGQAILSEPPIPVEVDAYTSGTVTAEQGQAVFIKKGVRTVEKVCDKNYSAMVFFITDDLIIFLSFSITVSFIFFSLAVLPKKS